MTERFMMRVSCKAALYTPDFSEVLLADYGLDGYGLPGGHMEERDTSPRGAMDRELFEELRLENVDLELKESWIHRNGKLILGYTGVVERATPITIQDEELAGTLWARVDDISSGKVTVRSYGEFILRQANANVGVSMRSSAPLPQNDHPQPSV